MTTWHDQKRLKRKVFQMSYINQKCICDYDQDSACSMQDTDQLCNGMHLRKQATSEKVVSVFHQKSFLQFAGLVCTIVKYTFIYYRSSLRFKNDRNPFFYHTTWYSNKLAALSAIENISNCPAKRIRCDKQNFVYFIYSIFFRK